MGAIHNHIVRSTRLKLCTPRKARFICVRRNYAATNPPKPSSSHRQVTTFNDDGRVRWSDLSVREKAARSTQQSFNFVVVITGLVMTGAVAALMWSEVFSTDSKTSYFNRTVSRIKKDPRCLDMLGDANKIKAYGEPSWNRWSRNRAIASRVDMDGVGVKHMRMHFNVEGPKGRGTVQLHMVQRVGEREWEYRYLALDVEGHPRIYLENADAGKVDTRKNGRMFGVRWW